MSLSKLLTEMVVSIFGVKPSTVVVVAGKKKRKDALLRSMTLLRLCSKSLHGMLQPSVEQLVLDRALCLATKRELFEHAMACFEKGKYEVMTDPILSDTHDFVEVAREWYTWGGPTTLYGDVTVTLEQPEYMEQKGGKGSYRVYLKTADNNMANGLSVTVWPRSAETGLVSAGCDTATGFQWRTVGYNRGVAAALDTLGFVASNYLNF